MEVATALQMSKGFVGADSRRRVAMTSHSGDACMHAYIHACTLKLDGRAALGRVLAPWAGCEEEGRGGGGDKKEGEDKKRAGPGHARLSHSLDLTVFARHYVLPIRDLIARENFLAETRRASCHR